MPEDFSCAVIYDQSFLVVAEPCSLRLSNFVGIWDAGVGLINRNPPLFFDNCYFWRYPVIYDSLFCRYSDTTLALNRHIFNVFLSLYRLFVSERRQNLSERVNIFQWVRYIPLLIYKKGGYPCPTDARAHDAGKEGVVWVTAILKRKSFLSRKHQSVAIFERFSAIRGQNSRMYKYF